MLFYADKLHPLGPRGTGRGIEETLARVAERHRRAALPGDAALETHADLVGASIALGEVHQAVADRLNPTLDEVFPELDALSSAGVLLGRCIYRSTQLLGNRDAGPLAGLLEAAASAVARATGELPADQLEARVPEGYAFYSLYPEMYLASLARVLRIEARRPSWTVIGIRSIGTSLASVVAGALVELGLPARVETLRPRGQPFDRYVEMGPVLRRRLLQDGTRAAGFLVVDEGPGLTCSSFLSVCSALSGLGVDETVVAILSAWQGAPSIYASEEGRQRWKQLRVFHTDAAEVFRGWEDLLPFVEQALSADPIRRVWQDGRPSVQIADLSYGRWRERSYPSPDRWPVVHRSTERTKLLIRYPNATGSPEPPLPLGEGRGEGDSSHPLPILAKFAGLGDYGREKYSRARALADAGFAPPVLGLAYGFLLYRFMESARPLTAADLSPALLIRMARYYAFVARRFPMPPAPRFQPLSEMILVNVREALGMDASGFVESWRSRQQAIDALPLVLIDGRPQPHEWLQLDSPDGPAFLKADGDDHFRDHTLVGEQSALWDLAGACEEWVMGEESRRELLQLWESETGDRQATGLLDFYRAAYLSFRVAALHYAVHSTDEEEIRRSLQHEQWKYMQRLNSLLKAEC